MRIGISGAGIAGSTLAYWLWQSGHEPTLIEKAPWLRTGGYLIDFWGAGYTIAERMGLAPALQTMGYAVQELRLIDRRGHKVGGFPVEGFRRSLGGRFTSVARGDLAALIYAVLGCNAETIFNDRIVDIEQRDGYVQVLLERGQRRRVSQIAMDCWSKDRVALIGDAACCVSLLAGEGTGLAMLQAYVLAGELNAAGGDHREAFHRSEQLLRPLIERKQRSARTFASTFAPKTSLGLWTRNQVTKLVGVRPLADWIIRHEFRDDIEIPDYAM